MADTPVVVISSTARDLPEHRREVMDACLRLGMFPKMMEHLPAAAADAVRISVALVDEAEIYQGIFAHRYGYVPAGYDISITEMEYDRAVARGIPRLIFLMHDDHPVRAADVEKGTNAAKLAALKARLDSEHVVSYFKSPEDLRAQVIHSLSLYRRPNPGALHYIGAIPAPPEAYIAHPYTLLQTKGLVGRRAELGLLTDWIATPGADVHGARILTIVAIGGMGKSALTWAWFHDIAPQRMKPLAGRLWWSFYESDATFENFVARALAYVARRPREEVQQLPATEREERLLAALDREPFLVVLDGLERLLVAYARLDAARLADEDLDERTANVFTGSSGLPTGTATAHTGQHRLRRAADARVGAFLRKLAGVRASRILISSRLYPADLQSVTGSPVPGCFAYCLPGMSDDDALGLWRGFGVGGTREALTPLFRAFDNYPLLIRALAGEVAGYRRAPGDFDRWRRDHPGFAPARLPLVQVRSHVLEFALRGLDQSARAALDTLAAFRMPAAYDTLAALLVGQGRPCAGEAALDAALTALEDRGLLGWDRRANRYDLHPVVRGVAWEGLDELTRRDLYGTLCAHFEGLPTTRDWRQINSLEDLAPAIELYNVLIGMERFDDAFIVFRDRLEAATLYRLSASRQRAELLERLFPDGLEQLPRLSDPGDRARTLNALAQGYFLSGRPGPAAPLYRRHIAIRDEEVDLESVSVGLVNLAEALLQAGSLHEAEASARKALSITRERDDIFREAVGLSVLGLILAARGEAPAAETAMRRASRLFVFQREIQFEGVVAAYLAQLQLAQGDARAACPLADRAWELAHGWRSERDLVRAARCRGTVALALGDATAADERLHHALARARAVNLVEEELPALTGLAELRRRQGDTKAARELLEDVWEPAEHGPYPLYHADAFNVLALVERDAGHQDAAIAAATAACRLAWCDGPPFAYHWGLEAARRHLAAWGASEPTDLDPFDEARHGPMPDIAIDPPIDVPIDPPDGLDGGAERE
jgi:tetratricopeptide (TPR) repeat protein